MELDGAERRGGGGGRTVEREDTEDYIRVREDAYVTELETG